MLSLKREKEKILYMQEIFFFNKNISFEINVHTDVSIRQESFCEIQNVCFRVGKYQNLKLTPF